MKFLLFFLGFSGVILAADGQDADENYDITLTESAIEQAKNKNYMDYQASTPCDERVSKALNEFFYIHGNPHSSHANGLLMDKFYRKARINLSKVIGAKPRNIYFTSGATESNNLAIKGIVTALPKGSHIITTVIEHKSVLEVFKYLEKEGYEVTYLKVDNKGILNPKDLEKAIKNNTKFVSIGAVNNEIGVIQDMTALGSICYKNNIILHSDCAQAFGKIKIDLKSWKVDALSISGHKVYAPKGIGALYINVKSLKRKGLKKFNPIFNGGGQQNSIRPGTLPIELVNAFGVAAEILPLEMEQDNIKNANIQRQIHQVLEEYNLKLKKMHIHNNGSENDNFTPQFILNGPEIGKNRILSNLSYSVYGVDIKDLLDELELHGFIISAGSACNADSNYSYVIDAIDPEMKLPPAVIRVSFGRFSDKHSGVLFAEILIKIVEDLRTRYPDKGVRGCTKIKKTIKQENSIENQKNDEKDQIEKSESKHEYTVEISKIEKDMIKEKQELEGLL